MSLETSVEFKSNIRIELEGTPESIKRMLFGIQQLAERLGVKFKVLGGSDD